MFSIKFLNKVRDFEFNETIIHFEKGSKLLEIGGGNGYQAKKFNDLGYDIKSIDVSDSMYKPHLLFEVTEYNGEIIPFADDSFDIVYSSNTLEHVKQLTTLQSEIKRVLKPNGKVIHILPTTTWRFYTSITFLIEGFIVIAKLLLALILLKNTKSNISRISQAFNYYTSITPHGEYKNSIVELYYFSSINWSRVFHKAGFKNLKIYSNNLFYTGTALMTENVSLKMRYYLSFLLGGSCKIYIMEPMRKLDV